MQISAINNIQLDKRCNNKKVNFQGNIGDKFVKEITSGINISPNNIIKEVKGTFGINSGKIEDVLESFIAKIQELTGNNKKLENTLNSKNAEIAEIPNKTANAVQEAVSNLKTKYENIIKSKDDALIKAQQETETAKAISAKYEPLVKVKSIEEIGTVLPQQAIKTLDEIEKNIIPARKSMYEFLTTGKGQEDALKQIERYNVMHKAAMDKITEIPEVANKLSNQDFKYAPSVHTISLIRDAIQGAPTGSQVISPVIRNQMKDNAMGILRPLIKKEHVEYYEDLLNKSLEEAADFHKRLARGVKRIKETKDKDIKFIENKPLNFDISEVAFTRILPDGNKRNFTFADLAFLGDF